MEPKDGYRSLSTTLLVKVLIISSIVTTVMTIISFSIDYNVEMSNLDARIEQVEQTSLPSITAGVFEYQEEQVQTQINAIANIDGLLTATILSPTGKSLYASKKNRGHSGDFLFIKTFSLYHDSTQQSLGTLQILGSKKGIYIKLMNKVMVFFVTQGAKTLIVSLILLFVFKYHVTNHLGSIYSYFAEKHYKSSELSLSKNSKDLNELDLVVNSINQMARKIRESELQHLSHIATQQQNLETASKMANLGQLTTGIAHEINNPLAIIQGHLHLLKRKVAEEMIANPGTKIINRMERIDEAVVRISSIVKGLITYSNSSNSLPSGGVEVSGIVEDGVNLLKERLLLDNINLQLDFRAGDAKSKINPSGLSETIINILTNAGEAVRKVSNPYIKVETEKNQNQIWIRVIDNGDGVLPELRDQIFEPFFTTKEAGQGVGLGLSVSKSLIESFGGTIVYQREKGLSYFSISLPLYIEDARLTLVS